MIQLEVHGKMPNGDLLGRVVRVRQGATVRELLSLLDMEALSGELIIIFNGASMNLTDPIDRDGKVILLPVICGG